MKLKIIFNATEDVNISSLGKGRTMHETSCMYKHKLFFCFLFLIQTVVEVSCMFWLELYSKYMMLKEGVEIFGQQDSSNTTSKSIHLLLLCVYRLRTEECDCRVKDRGCKTYIKLFQSKTSKTSKTRKVTKEFCGEMRGKKEIELQANVFYYRKLANFCSLFGFFVFQKYRTITQTQTCRVALN